MRLFVGTLLQESNQALFDGFARDLVGAHPDSLRSIPSSSAHLTYAFCGNADAVAAAAIVGAVMTTAASHASFPIALGNPHIIWSGSTPRLVCARLLSGEADVHRLTEDLLANLERACPHLALSPGKAPHVTLARFRKRMHRSDSRMVADWLARSGTRADTTDRISCLQVVSSTLTAAGPAYGVEAQAPLIAVSSRFETA